MIAMPTGSFAPDSPSSRVPERPVISRLPSTENTTAGSVGARAAPMSKDASHSNPKTVCASTASAAVVTTVPATPSHATPARAGRIRSQPMCMPPSKRISTSATVTIRWSVTIGSSPRRGTTSEATAATIRKRAGAGIRSRSANRLDPTASTQTAATRRTACAKGTRSSIGVLRGRGHVCRPDFPAHRR